MDIILSPFLPFAVLTIGLFVQSVWDFYKVTKN